MSFYCLLPTVNALHNSCTLLYGVRFVLRLSFDRYILSAFPMYEQSPLCSGLFFACRRKNPSAAFLPDPLRCPALSAAQTVLQVSGRCAGQFQLHHTLLKLGICCLFPQKVTLHLRRLFVNACGTPTIFKP